MGLDLTNHPLCTMFVDDAIATPIRYDRESRRIQGCLYDAKGQRLDLAARVTGIGGDRLICADPDSICQDSTRRVEEESIYLGYLMGHYGHFLLETLSTFWALSYFPRTRPVLHPYIFGHNVKDFMRPFFRAFDLRESEILIVQESTSFRRIIVPERTFHLNSAVHARQLELFKTLCGKIVQGTSSGEQFSTERVYLSRARLNHGDTRKVDNEVELENIFEENGFQIIHPQELTIQEQLRIYSKCSVMAGLSGSALHNCVFMKENSLLIEIGDPRSPSRPLATQVLCNKLSGVRSVHIPYFPETDSATRVDLGRISPLISRALC